MRFPSLAVVLLSPLAACQQATEAESPSGGGVASMASAGVGIGGSAAGAPMAGGFSGQASGGVVAIGGSVADGGAMASGGAGSGVVGGSTTAGGGGLPALEECSSKPSIDRFTEWTASGEGATIPATGSILVEEGGEYVGKVAFVGSEWHVIPVLIANAFDATHDLSGASGFTLTYSATAELHAQLRSKSHWSGGDQYATTIPSTGGQVETRTFSFAAAGWQSLFGTPALSWADTLKEGMGLVFVGNSENEIVFSGLRIDGFTPTCP